TREALAIGCERRIDADATVRVLDRLIADRGGAPEHIRCDNGPELTANALRDWCRFNQAGSAYIEPGSPWQNAYVESFGSRVRDELLGVELLPDPDRGPTPRRGLAPRLQHEPTALGAWHDGAGRVRRPCSWKRMIAPGRSWEVRLRLIAGRGMFCQSRLSTLQSTGSSPACPAIRLTRWSFAP